MLMAFANAYREPLRGDVAHRDEDRGAALVMQRARIDRDLDLGAVGLAMPPDFFPLLRARGVVHELPKPVVILARADVGQRHRQKLLPAEAVMLDRRVVDRE